MVIDSETIQDQLDSWDPLIGYACSSTFLYLFYHNSQHSRITRSSIIVDLGVGGWGLMSREYILNILLNYLLHEMQTAKMNHTTQYQ